MSLRIALTAFVLAGALAVAAASESVRAPAAYDPAAAARASLGKVANPWATIPPQCWTKTDDAANPCWACHAPALPPNELADWHLQEQFAFPPGRSSNPWTNLFRDRSAEIAAISDDAILAWVREDNYGPLREAVAATPGFPGYAPDLDLHRGFDAEGFALDGSDWRAVRFKPFPGAFWPTNGSADDVMIRLPDAFRRDAAGRASRDVYRANLAILEAAIGSDPFRLDPDLDHPVEPVDERAAGADLDRDGSLGTATRIRGLPATFVGGAAGVAVHRRLYPAGTEFLHSVRYLDPDAPGLAARRMKELRYARKVKDLPPRVVSVLWGALREDEAAEMGGAEPPPTFGGDALRGLVNDFGWLLQAYIEDAQGRLRLQTDEEHLACMGCHSTLGATVDQTFSFARKLPGADGWRPQDLRGQKDVPQAGSDEPEILRWVRRARGGDEFRGNDEFAARFAPGGVADEAALRRAAPGGDRDLAWLLAPTRERALLLDKAYLAIVREQSFVLGRDAVPAPAPMVHRDSPPASTGLREAGARFRDGRVIPAWGRLRRDPPESHGNALKSPEGESR